MRLLSFEIKRNLKKPPRVYVKASKTRAIYGSFPANEPEKFEGLEKMSDAEKAEFKPYLNNLKAVAHYIGSQYIDEQADYRLRLPMSFTDAIDEISLICDQSSIELDIYDPIVSSIIQTLKIAVAQLDEESKIQALKVLDKIGLSEYKKLDYSRETQAVFAEILLIHNKSEKLKDQAVTLFNKDKSYSPKAIESMATGESKPTKWLTACAIVILLEERRAMLNSILTHDDLFMLFAKPLIDNKQQEKLKALIENYKLNFLSEKFTSYQPKD
jgi:hypothetical protein